KKTLALAHVLPVVLALAMPAALAASEKKPLPKDLPPFGTDKPLPVPEIAQSKLPNSLNVWLVHRSNFPRAAVMLTVRDDGTASDPKNAKDITKLLANT